MPEQLFLDSVSTGLPLHATTNQLHYRLRADAGHPLIKHNWGQAKLGTFSKQTMQGAGPYL